MNKDKLLSDIRILDDLILSEELNIAHIENQIEVKELTTDGSDLYFDWRVSAITAASHKKARIKSIKRQSDYWKDVLLLSTSSDKARIREENIARSKQNKIKAEHVKEQKKIAHHKLIKLQQKTVIAREVEKTERHRLSELRDIKISKSFKRIVKEFLGRDKYIELIEMATNDADCRILSKKGLVNE